MFIGNEAMVTLKDASDQSTSNYINAAFIDVRFIGCCFRKQKTKKKKQGTVRSITLATEQQLLNSFYVEGGQHCIYK